MTEYSEFMQNSRIQYDEDGKLWQYHNNYLPNPCGCGCNVFHYVYIPGIHAIYGVCNACDTLIYELDKKCVDKKLKTGVWKINEV